MYELRYKKPGLENPVDEICDDESKVSYSALGVAIRITQKSTMIIPWHRVTGITSNNTYIRDVMNLFPTPYKQQFPPTKE